MTLYKANAVAGVTLKVASTKYLIEGMTVDIRDTAGDIITGGGARRVLSVNRSDNEIIISGANITTAATDLISVQGSYGIELTGMEEIFKSTGSLYGVDRTANHWMVPYIGVTTGVISDIKIRKSIDYQEEIMGAEVDYLLGPSGVVRSYYEYLEATKRNVNTLKLDGGFTSIGRVCRNTYGIYRFIKSGTGKLLCLLQRFLCIIYYG